MIGGLKTTASGVAMAAALGLFMGGLSPAQAADLGGDCCADLEERVAELEATTVRKGNRKVSVKVSGQINYLLLIWDDGEDTDAYIVDNVESSSRFRFTGSAKFKPGWSAGFQMEVEFDGANSSSVSQVSDGAPNENQDLTLDGRKVAWWIKNDRLGEIWMGRTSPATDDITLINLADTPNVDASNEIGNGFFLRVPQGTGGCAGTGCLINATLGAIAPSIDPRRAEVIRYNTPSLGGFVFSVAWGEDDDFDIAARYKKEWNSIRVAGGIGYRWDTDETEPAGAIVCPDAVPVASGFAAASAPCRANNVDIEQLLGSISAMHMPTGLYVYFGGSHGEFNDNFRGPVTGSGRGDISQWYLQGGVKRRWLARNLGATTIYGEYQEFDGFLEAQSGAAFAGSAGLGGVVEIASTEVQSWGFGIVQNIDKAAMQLWASFREFEPEVDVLNDAGATASVPLEDFWTVQLGGKLKF
ncbi:MAG: porin [Hyphomicrobiales bacterium]|nr:porin [Hyphomicrobiales bacterium]